MSEGIIIQKSDNSQVRALVNAEYHCDKSDLTKKLEQLPSRIFDAAPSDNSRLILQEHWACWKDQRSGERYFCLNCNYNSTQRAYIRQHVDVTHCNVRPFKCPFCDYAGKRSHALREHMLLHSRIRPYKCDSCPATFRKKNHLTTHYRSHLKKISAICPICKLQVSKLMPMIDHLRAAHENETFICDSCDYFSIIFQEFTLHLKKEHQNISVNLKCGHCNDFTCNFKQLMVLHLKQVHNQIEEKQEDEIKKETLILKCSVCGFITPSQNELKLHMSDHIEEIDKNDSQQSGFIHDGSIGLFRCTICSYTCELQRTMKSHIWKHAGSRKVNYPCFELGNGNEDKLEDGITIIEEVDNLQEDEEQQVEDGENLIVGCHVDVSSTLENNSSIQDLSDEHNYTSFTKRRRQESEDERVAIAKFFVDKLNNLAVATSPENFQKDSCNSTPRSHSPGICSTLLEVAENCLKHENVSKNLISCSLCSHKAKTTIDLEKHTLEKHCRLKTYNCKYCSVSFYYKAQLRAHLVVHETEDIAEFGTIKCSQCLEVFQSTEQLKKHENNVHSIDDSNKNVMTLQCSQCDFVAISSRALKSHQKRHTWDARYVHRPLEQYKCAFPLCGYVCHHLPSLKSHMWKHSSNTSYSYSATNDAINAALDGRSHPHTAALVTFRCCQCGFESNDRQMLTDHMSKHQDIIEKTLMINQAAIGM